MLLYTDELPGEESPATAVLPLFAMAPPLLGIHCNKALWPQPAGFLKLASAASWRSPRNGFGKEAKPWPAQPTVSLCCGRISSLKLVAAASDAAAAAANVHRGRELHLSIEAAELGGGLADAAVLRVALLVALAPAWRALQSN